MLKMIFSKASHKKTKTNNNKNNSHVVCRLSVQTEKVNMFMLVFNADTMKGSLNSTL